MLYILIVITLLLFALAIFICIKSEITFNNRRKIIDAIYRYQIHCIGNNSPRFVDYEDMESYDKTLYRLYDFGYERILPEDKFKIIESYIK